MALPFEEDEMTHASALAEDAACKTRMCIKAAVQGTLVGVNSYQSEQSMQ